MLSVNVLRASSLAALLLGAVSAQAVPYYQADLLGSWCFHTLEYADGNQSNEKATYQFGASGQVTVQEFSYETRSGYHLKHDRLKMDKFGRFTVLQLTQSELLLKKPNQAVMYLSRGACQ